MAIRVLEITLRLKFEDEPAPEERREIADTVRAEIEARAAHDGFGTDHWPCDVVTLAEWSAK